MGIINGLGNFNETMVGPIRNSEIIQSIVGEAEDAIVGRIEGESAKDGVLLEGKTEYVGRVYDVLVSEGFTAVFREDESFIGSRDLYRINVDELVEKYRNGRGIIED